MDGGSGSGIVFVVVVVVSRRLRRCCFALLAVFVLIFSVASLPLLVPSLLLLCRLLCAVSPSGSRRGRCFARVVPAAKMSPKFDACSCLESRLCSIPRASAHAHSVHLLIPPSKQNNPNHSQPIARPTSAPSTITPPPPAATQKQLAAAEKRSAELEERSVNLAERAELAERAAEQLEERIESSEADAQDKEEMASRALESAVRAEEVARELSEDAMTTLESAQESLLRVEERAEKVLTEAMEGARAAAGGGRWFGGSCCVARRSCWLGVFLGTISRLGKKYSVSCFVCSVVWGFCWWCCVFFCVVRRQYRA